MNQKWIIENNRIIDRPKPIEIKNTLIEHYELLKKVKCEKVALLEMRSIATYYVKGLKNNSIFKQPVSNVKTEKEFYDIINKYFDYLDSETNSCQM